MTTLIKHSNRVRAARAFLDNIDDGITKLYIGLSGTSVWTDENDPPLPDASIADSEAFWDELFGIAQIQPEDTMLVVPRRNWLSNTGYYIFQTDYTDCYELPYYVLASNNHLYECTGTPSNNILHVNATKIVGGGVDYAVDDIISVSGGTASTTTEFKVVSIGATGDILTVSIQTVGDYTVLPTNPVNVIGGSGNSATFELSWVGDDASTEPSHLSGVNIGADGYEWTELFDISTYTHVLTDYWCPVEDDYGLQSKLGANHVMIRRHIPDTASTSGKIAEATYRKVGVLLDPLTTGDLVVDVIYGNDSDFDPLFSEQDNGVLLMIDNRTPVVRQTSQTETIYSIIKF